MSDEPYIWHRIGIGLAQYVLANLYRNMGENKEAIRNYKQCKQALSNIESYLAALICVYPFY